MDTFYEIDLPQNKCCHMGYSFNANYQCELIPDNSTYNTDHHNETQDLEMKYKCPKDYSIIFNFAPEDSSSNLCSDVISNGTEIFASCYKVNHTSTTDESIGAIIMWGTQTYMTTNIAHVILCIIIVALYCFIPELSKSLYNRAILRHYISLMCLGITLSIIGYLNLCNCSINSVLLSCIWLTLQYFTLATVFWLNVICYDMTLVITGFEWLRNITEDNKKLLTYGFFAWGCALVPVLFAATFEFAPGLPNDFILTPKYTAYRGERRWIVNYYFFFLPMLTLLCNNGLFIYTTYKMMRINQSTEMATSNRNKALRKNYLVFLRLYLLMGAPWFFGCLFAFIFNELIILKFCRVLQPALWLVILLTNRNIRKTILKKKFSSVSN